MTHIVTKGGEYMIQQCINCQTVWEDFNSNELKSYCSDKCKKEYEKYLKKLEKQFRNNNIRKDDFGKHTT